MKKTLLNLIDYLHYQVENDKCTVSEMHSIYKSVTENLNVTATADDLAKFFGQNPSNVRNVLAKYPNKPTPKRNYNLIRFFKIMPNGWFRNK